MYWILDASGNRQKWAKPEVSNFIEMITPEDTPILSRLASVQAANTQVRTLQDDLDEGDPTNAIGYEEDFPAGGTSTPGSLTNQIQRFAETAKVNRIESQVASNGGVYGVGDLLQREEGKKLNTLQLSVEKRLISDGSSQSATASNNWKGLAAGLVSLIQTHTDSSTSGDITTSAIDDILQSIQDDGGSPTDMFCNAAQKKVIDGLTTNITRYSEETETLRNTVRTYMSSFGQISVHYHRFLPQDVNGSPAQVLVLQFGMIRLRPLSNPRRESLEDTGSGPSTAIEWPVTWDMRTEKACGQFTNLN